MNKKIKYLSIFFIMSSTLFAQTFGDNDKNIIPKINRVIPLEMKQTENSSDVFYTQDFEQIQHLKDEFHDTGNLSDTVMSLSALDAFSGKKAIRNSYIPKNHFKKGEDPGGSGWVWRYFGDNKVVTSLPIQDTTAQLQIFARWYHKFEEGFMPQEGKGTLPPKMARMRCMTTPWKAVYTVLFWIEGKKGFITIQQHTRAPNVEREWRPNYNTTFYLNTPQNLGRWIHFELGVILGEGHHSDRIRAWADGKLICDLDNQDLAGGYRKETLNAMSLDCYWNGGSPRRQSRYYDDFVLSKAPIGPARTGNNPVIEIAQSLGENITNVKEYQLEVAQTTQYPMSINDPDRKQPVIEYKTVWIGKSKDKRVGINSTNGKFINELSHKDKLDYNKLYSVRLRLQQANGQWSDWSEWHASFATQWEPGTSPENNQPPKGYLIGHNLKTDAN